MLCGMNSGIDVFFIWLTRISWITQDCGRERGARWMSDPKMIVILVAVLILLVGAAHQICCAIYALGCFRKFNRAVNIFMKWLDGATMDETTEAVASLVFVGFGLAILVAVVL